MVDKEMIDAEVIQALVSSFGKMDMKSMLKLLKGTPMNFKAEFEEIPLDITLKFQDDAILIRVKLVDAKE